VLKLVIGNKNYSSWSMRAWIALRANGIAFEEIFIPLYTGAADKQRILDVAPSGKVPVLLDGDHGLGFARHYRISRRAVSAKTVVA
jgi:glutathione S-transferase